MHRTESSRRVARLHAECELSMVGVLLWVAAGAVLVVLLLVNALVGDPPSRQGAARGDAAQAPSA